MNERKSAFCCSSISGSPPVNIKIASKLLRFLALNSSFFFVRTSVSVRMAVSQRPVFSPSCSMTAMAWDTDSCRYPFSSPRTSRCFFWGVEVCAMARLQTRSVAASQAGCLIFMRNTLSQKSPGRLEDELAADLADAAGSGVRDLAELAAVGVTAHRIAEEVGMVEDVEHLDAEIQLGPLRDLRVFFHAGVGIDGAGSVEQVLAGSAGLAANLISAAQSAGEGIDVEVSVCRQMRVELLDGRDLRRVVKPDIGQGEVPAALHVYRETGVEACNAGDVPSLAVAMRPHETVERQFPVVAGYQVVPQVEGGETIIVTIRGAGIIDRSHRIQRLGIGVPNQEGNIAGAAFDRHLQRVVVRDAGVLDVIGFGKGHHGAAARVMVIGADGLVVDRAHQGTVDSLPVKLVHAAFAARPAS